MTATVQPPEGLYPVRVTIPMSEDKEDTVFTAYTDRDRWNGFIIPSFTLAEARRVMEWTNANSADLPEDIRAEQIAIHYDEARAVFILTEQGETEEIHADTNDLYTLGYGWTWEEVDPADDHAATFGLAVYDMDKGTASTTPLPDDIRFPLADEQARIASLAPNTAASVYNRQTRTIEAVYLNGNPAEVCEGDILADDLDA